MSLRYTPPAAKAKSTDGEDSDSQSSRTVKAVTRQAKKTVPQLTSFIRHTDKMQQYCDQFDRIDVSTMCTTMLKQKVESLNMLWASVATAYDSISSLDESQLSIASVDSKYFATLDKKDQTAVNISNLIQIQNPSPQQIVMPSYAPNQSHTYLEHDLKLPPCDTEVFHGGYEQWPSFRDMFTAVYINHPKLSPAQKLYHLRNKTRGKALDVIKKFQLSDNNFEIAWEALRSRYDNKRILVDNQVDILLELQQIHYENSESLNKLQSTINNCLAALNSQNVPTDTWDPIS